MARRPIREERERRFGRRFFALVGGVWIGTLLIFGATTVNWFHGVSLAQFALMVVFLFSFAFVFSKRVLSLVLPPFRLPSLDRLDRQPTVAVLYTTMNDVVPDCLRAIHQDYPVDVFVLDDSSDPGKRAVVDRVAGEVGATVLRREGRKGFKAGAINRWLSVHGREYEYFVQAGEKTGAKYAESDLSAIVEIKPSDHFPPGAPAGLAAVPGTKSIELVWDRNTEADVASYRVYRDGVKVADALQSPAFSDKDVMPGGNTRMR